MNKYLKITLSVFFVFFLLGISYAQKIEIKSTVTDASSKLPIENAQIVSGDIVSTTNVSGEFKIVLNVGTNFLIVSAFGYETNALEVNIIPGMTEIQTISLISTGMKAATGTDASVVSITELETDRVDQNVSGLLVNNQDFLISTASFNFGFANFRFRGYGSEYYDVYINGINMNQSVTGRPVWAEWGGLNDAMRNQESHHGLATGGFGFGSVGGSSNINARASHFNKQQKASYAMSNRSYDNRIMYTYGSGILQNGWSFALNASKRWADEGYVKGTAYDAFSLFGAAEKRFNNKHSLAITAFASPYKRAMQGPSTQEAYDLTGSNYYNPNWGWQEGEIRNARIRKLVKPTLILNHYWNPSNKLRINNAVSYSYSDFGTTSLGWYDAPDPRPDYYRYLPSFHEDPIIKQLYTQAWQNDESVSQINWNKLYQINYLQNLENKQAKYIIENRKIVTHTINVHPSFKFDLSLNTALYGGVEAQYATNDHHKKIQDLLGGEFWLDIDQFAERDFPGDPNSLQNDLQNIGAKYGVGDIFGYRYSLNRSKLKQWAMIQTTFKDYDAFLAYSADFTSYQRDGKMQNGRYPDNSLGKSEALNFFNFSAKGGLTYKFTGKDFFRINLGYLTQPPALSDIFTAPQIANKFIANIQDEKILSGDLSYVRSGRKLSGRITLYQTMFYDQTNSINFYHDDLKTYVNYTQTDVNKIHQGIEAGFNLQVIEGLNWVNFANIGNYIFTSRPEATISYYNGARPDTTKTVYSKYFYETGGPQFAATSGLRYSSSKFWFLNVFVNYIDKNYMSFNPERRTELAIANIGPGDPLINAITDQYKFDPGYTVDISFGKSWRIKRVHFVNLNIGVNNALNNTNLRTGGFEQMRFDFATKNVDKFPPKYFYAYGRNYFAMLSYRF